MRLLRVHRPKWWLIYLIDMSKTKIAIVSGFTADLLPDFLAKDLIQYEIDPEWYVAPFNQMVPQVKQSDSGSKTFNPAILILLFDPQDFLDRKTETLALIEDYAKGFPGTEILVNNTCLLQVESLSLFKSNSPRSVYYDIYKINQQLLELTGKLKNVHILDFFQLTAEVGRQNLFDPKYFYLAKIPFGSFGLREVSALVAKAVNALLGKRKKCLVLDLDNVLWGGVLSEDGAAHLKLDPEGEGKAFFDFQKRLLELYQSGVILAICSKNDRKPALEAIVQLPHMVLREDKFSALRINWLDKAQNLKSLASELNLGLNSFVFLDDSPFERAAVKKVLPEVTVPEMPGDFSHYPSFLAGLPYFEIFSLTPEDSRRGELYVQERKRNELKEQAISFNDFLHSLHIKVSVKRPDRWSLPRIAQLTQKTNQFNLSLNRYQEADIALMAKNKKALVYYVSVKDDLGDAGIVGVGILKPDGKTAFLDTFLLSCRVLGRGIEDAVLHLLAGAARDAGAKTLRAKYNSNEKNFLVKEFLLRTGFTQEKGFFSRNLQNLPDLPAWTKLEK